MPKPLNYVRYGEVPNEVHFNQVLLVMLQFDWVVGEGELEIVVAGRPYLYMSVLGIQ